MSWSHIEVLILLETQSVRPLFSQIPIAVQLPTYEMHRKPRRGCPFRQRHPRPAHVLRNRSSSPRRGIFCLLFLNLHQFIRVEVCAMAALVYRASKGLWLGLEIILVEEED